MRMTRLAIAACGTFLAAPGLLGAAPAGGPTSEELAAQVRATETAFAASMAARDHAAFVKFLDDEAVFFGRTGVMHGKLEVAAGWKPLFEGPKPPFSWAPEQVEVLSSGTLALSSGPVLDPNGRRTSTFSSIWRRTADGSWKIVFDKGSPYCEEAVKPKE